MKPKLKVGDKLFSLNVGDAARHAEQKLTPVTVVKVGLKYFSVKEKENSYFLTQHYIDGWVEVTDYSARARLYASEQEWEDEKEERRICKFLGEHFQYGANKANLPLGVLRIIEERILKNISQYSAQKI